MHWADVIAKDIAERCDKPLIATGISPSGEIHVGSLRESVTGESVRSALEHMGKDVRLIYLVDSFDPLRKRYEFLPESYEQYVNMPLCDIPCPCGKHESYAHHYVEPFLRAMKEVDVRCEVIYVHDLYRQGRFAETIDMAFKRRERAMEILRDVTGRDMKPDWAPFNPLCEECGRFTDPILDSYEFPYVEYRCKCGHHGKADIRKGEGKMPWRLEWPAKWKIFGTSVEPFGKDHAASGGSYDSGKVIVKEIFDGEAPIPIPYEFVQFKSKGKVQQMHKSKGSVVSGMDAIMMNPPEVVKYIFLRVNPQKSIDYDYMDGMPIIADEYDKVEREYYSEDGGLDENIRRAYEISRNNIIPEKQPLQVPYGHLVNLVQLTDSTEGLFDILKRTGYLDGADDDDIRRITIRAAAAKYWLDGGFADARYRFSVGAIMPGLQLSGDEKAFLADLHSRLSAGEWTSDAISQAVSDAGAASPIGAKGAFKVMYEILIAKERGPRLGNFLASMDRDFVLGRILEESR